LSNGLKIFRSEDGSYYSYPFGTAGDIPAVGDFDADGKADFAQQTQTGIFVALRTAARRFSSSARVAMFLLYPITTATVNPILPSGDHRLVNGGFKGAV
jgi:hypothetical protein